MPGKGEQLVSAGGEVWVVLRCHQAGDDPSFFALDVIRKRDLPHTSSAVNLTWDEFEDFCLREGIPYPAEPPPA